MLCHWDGLLQSFQSTSRRSRACIPFIQEPIFPVEQPLRSTGHQHKHVLTAADASGTNMILVRWKGSKPLPLQHRPAHFLAFLLRLRTMCRFFFCREKDTEQWAWKHLMTTWELSSLVRPTPNCTELEPVASYIPPCVLYVTSVVRPNKVRCLGWDCASYESLTLLSYTGHRGDAFRWYRRWYGSTTMVYHDNGKEC